MIVQKGFEPDEIEELDAPKSPLVPAERGSLRTLCRGRLLAICGHYGWITSLDKIDHPDAESVRHEGRVYLKSTDVRHGCGPLKPGAEVLFALYADSDGLGAEDCHPAHVNEEGLSGAGGPAGEVAVNEKTWLPGVASRKKQHWQRQDYRPPPTPSAVVLVPPEAVFEWLAERPITPNQTRDNAVFQLNMRRILDMESSSDDSSEDEDNGSTQRTKRMWSSLAGRCAKAIGAVDDARSWPARSDAVAAKQAGSQHSACYADPMVSVLDSMAAKASRASDVDSTSAGDASDSDGGATTTGLIIAPPPGLELPAGSPGRVSFAPPPGLDAPLPPLRPAAGATPSQQHPWRPRRA